MSEKTQDQPRYRCPICTDGVREMDEYGDGDFPKGLHFANELHKVGDMLRCDQEDFLYSYGYLSEKDYYRTIQFIINLIKKHFKENEMDTETFQEMWGNEIYFLWGEEYYDLLDKDTLDFYEKYKEKFDKNGEIIDEDYAEESELWKEYYSCDEPTED